MGIEPHDLVFETASEHLSSSVPVATPEARAGDLRRSLIGKRFETAANVAICEDGRLVGLLSLEALLAAAEDAPVAGLMDANPPVVAPGTDQEVAAWKAVQQGETSLAVVDEDGRFLGLIPPRRILGVLLWEHEEDMARLGGFIHDTSAARTASEEAVGRRFWHRLPWLLMGLAGALLAADIVGAFEATLEKNVILVFFVPGVVYLADAVGTQTETLVIRGLSVGVPVGRVVRREALTGVLVGAAISLAFFPVALIRWGQGDVALAVALALFAACSMATLVAMLLPWLFHRMGRDPAFGSGPLATVVQDLLSILIYLAIAQALVD
ncbi:MAG: magnesium transporter [Dehalococcoidia bacterium]